MSTRLKFHISKHFALRVAERGLSIEHIKNVVNYSREAEDLNVGKNGGKLKKFRKSNGRTIIVIAEIKNQDCWLATAYYED